MSNCCDFVMRVVGEKDDVQDLVKWLNADYDLVNHTCTEARHFYNIKDVTDLETFQQSTLNQSDDEIITFDLEGFCAWSVYDCMFDGKFTYYKQCKGRYGTNMEEATKLLNLKVEIISTEPYQNFTEHFLVINGEIILNQKKRIFNDEELEGDVSELIFDKYEEIYDFVIS